MTLPIIDTELTLIPADAGGRRHSIDLRGSVGAEYRPHIVIGDPHQGVPIVKEGIIAEKYLGVQFCPADVVLRPGDTARVKMLLMYYPEAPSIYGMVLPGGYAHAPRGRNGRWLWHHNWAFRRMNGQVSLHPQAVPPAVRAETQNKGMKLTKPGQRRSFAAHRQCSADNWEVLSGP